MKKILVFSILGSLFSLMASTLAWGQEQEYGYGPPCIEPPPSKEFTQGLLHASMWGYGQPVSRDFDDFLNPLNRNSRSSGKIEGKEGSFHFTLMGGRLSPGFDPFCYFTYKYLFLMDLGPKGRWIVTVRLIRSEYPSPKNPDCGHKRFGFVSFVNLTTSEGLTFMFHSHKNTLRIAKTGPQGANQCGVAFSDGFVARDAAWFSPVFLQGLRTILEAFKYGSLSEWKDEWGPAPALSKALETIQGFLLGSKFPSKPGEPWYFPLIGPLKERPYWWKKRPWDCVWDASFGYPCNQFDESALFYHPLMDSYDRKTGKRKKPGQNQGE